MRLLVLSDIHANIDALVAVLEAADREYTDVICLGDLVGYGGAPEETLTLIRTLAPRWMIRGNHDRVCAGLTTARLFSPSARTAIEWTRGRLSPQDLLWLAGLPPGPLTAPGQLTLCHGAPFDEDFYVMSSADARLVLRDRQLRVCLHGHTHQQSVYRLTGQALMDDSPVRRATATFDLDGGDHWLINPGSVGQPRDGDPRAAYGVLDLDAGRLDLRRVPYDVARAQARIRAAGLPDGLADRLALGE